MNRFLIALLMMGFATAQAAAKPYVVDTANSTVSFSGTHADNPFKGKFETWTADIDFDPDNLGASHINANFDPASAKTGNTMYDGTLPEADWFDVKNHKQSTFVSKEIKADGKGGYTATGDLTIRGITKPVTFSFTLSDLKTAPVKAKGTFEIDRFAYDLGKKSDDKAEWVGKTITIELDIAASPKP